MNSYKPIKILTVVGARPNFMKAAPIIRAIRRHNANGSGPEIHHLLVHTGQHYDAIMSDRFFEDLELPRPDVHLGVGSGTQAAQTAEILQKFEGVVAREWPDIVIVVGDVNSTVACALAAAKLPVTGGRVRPLITHVEAGLRSFDRDMPEEVNRVLTDHLSDLLFVTEKAGLQNLRKEGISPKKVFFVGNTMIDSLVISQKQASESSILNQLGLRSGAGQNGIRCVVEPYALLTLHRPSNVDEAESFRNILDGLAEFSGKTPIIFPVHPRTRSRIEEFGYGEYFHTTTDTPKRNGIRLLDPLGYLDFVCLMKNARLVLTDSGGVQEETTCLRVPCVTIRENTERPVTATQGTNVIAGTSVAGIRKAIARQLARKRPGRIPEKWDGKAAERILPVLLAKVKKQAAEMVEQIR